MVLIPASMLVLIALAAAVAFVVTAGVLLRRGAVAEPACGRCRYPVAGLPSFVCPECGSDLRTVGILTDQLRRRLPRRSRAGLWTLLIPVPALIISVALGELVEIQAMTSRITLTNPKSGAYRKIEVLEIARGHRSRPLLLEELSILVTRLDGGDPIRLDVDPKTLTHWYRDEGGDRIESTAPLDAAAVVNWMTTMGVSGTDEAIMLEVEEAVAMLKRDAAAMKARNDGPVTHNFNAPGGLGVRGDYSTPIWFIVGAAVLWLAVWLVGLRRIFR